MCNQCQKNPVYEFTNKRKLCKTCFLHYFQKKVLYTIRKFEMIRTGDILKYNKNNDFKEIVLEYVLKSISSKIGFELDEAGKKANKIAIASSLDSEAEKIIETLIDRNSSQLKEFLPVYKNVIKPLYLFLDEEILLYARLKNLKFKKYQSKNGKNKIKDFEDEFEKKHPEAKRAIVNSVLELYD